MLRSKNIGQAVRPRALSRTGDSTGAVTCECSKTVLVSLCGCVCAMCRAEKKKYDESNAFNRTVFLLCRAESVGNASTFT